VARQEQAELGWTKLGRTLQGRAWHGRGDYFLNLVISHLLNHLSGNQSAETSAITARNLR